MLGDTLYKWAATITVPTWIAMMALSTATLIRMVMSTAMIIRLTLTAMSMPVVMWIVTSSGFADFSILLVFMIKIINLRIENKGIPCGNTKYIVVS